MWQAFLRYRTLDSGARKLFWNAIWMLLFIFGSLRVRGFNATRDALLRRSGAYSKVRQGTTDGTVQQTCRMVRAAAHYGPRHGTCLEQSLALWYLLQKQNVPASLRIGVRKTTEKFEAHAWVEHEGLALNDDPEVHQHYAAFAGEFAGYSGEKS